jgi:shikimate dehydrogenase
MDQYRVYGNPIKQSKSPFIHQQFAKQTAQNISYQSELVALGQFEQTVKQFMLEGGKGANVTAPYKEEAMAICDHLSERAKLAGAVNTLSFVDGEIYGDTTDGDGLVNDLLNNHIVLANKRVLLLGAGGAAKGVVLPLLEQNIAHLTIANRTVAKAQTIIDQYPTYSVSACSFDEASNAHFDIIINATSAGLNGQKLPISDDLVNENSICYDMTYAKTLTPFLTMASNNQAKVIIDGLGMLVGQAAVSFNIWRKVKPTTDQVLTALRSEMAP